MGLPRRMVVASGGHFLAQPQTMRLALNALTRAIKRAGFGPQGVRADLARHDVIVALLGSQGVPERDRVMAHG